MTKKSMRRKAPLIVIGIVAILISGLLFHFDAIARSAIEQGTHQAMGVETSVGDVTLGVFKGRFGISGFEARNPEGYQSENFFSLRDGRLNVGLASLRHDTIEVPELTLQGIEINLEVKGRESNYGAVLDNLKKKSGGLEKGRKTRSPEKRIVIEKLTIEDVVANIQVTGWGRDVSTEVQIPRIHLEGVGSNNGGLMVSELTGVVLSSVLHQVAGSSGGLPGNLKSQLRSELRSLGNLDEMITHELDGSGRDALSEVSGELKKQTKELEKLFD